MVSLATLLSVYCVAVVAASIFGGWLPSFIRLTHVRMQFALSFVGGLMLGVGLLHMLPHSVVQTNSMDFTLMWLLVGLLGMFFLIRIFHFHQHGPAASDAQDNAAQHADDATAAHDHDAGHKHSDACHNGVGSVGGHQFRWIGVALGLSLHSFMDGIAMAAAAMSEAAHFETVQWAGLSVFLAVLLHKPLDALSVTTLMHASGWSQRDQQVVNAGFAMMCPLGAWCFAMGVDTLAEQQANVVGGALALSAGVFLCISLSDLLPELQFHQHDRLKLSAALIAGVLAAYSIRFLEPHHAHAIPAAAQQHNHASNRDR